MMKDEKSRSGSSSPCGPSDLGEIISAPLDTKRYKAIELSNGLRSFLVSTCQHKVDIPNRCKYQRIQEFNKKYVGIDEPEILPINTSCCCVDATKYNDATDCTTTASKVKNRKPTTCCKELASACIVVAAGSFSDPVDVPGMAHFCEHNVLFGSTKYTKEGILFKLVHQYGGKVNAFTRAEFTGYFFSCDPSHFETVLDVFADMMARPLLRPNLAIKEVASIDSEFSTIQAFDLTRASDFLGLLAKPDHPFFAFGWGNKQSLGDRDLHRKLLAWHKRHYGANYMTLCLQGPYPIDKLEEMTLTYFSKIERNSCEHPQATLARKGEPYNPNAFGKIYRLLPTSNIRVIFISWCLPPALWKNYTSNPLLVLKTLFNDESEGSLVNYLRTRHWITDFSSGCSRSGVMTRTCFGSLYSFIFCLTERGLQEWEKVIIALASFIKFLISESAQIQRIYDRLKVTQATVFHYQDWEEKMGSTLDHALNLQTVPTRHILTSKNLITDPYNEGTFSGILDLMDFRQASIVVMAREFVNDQNQIKIMNGRFVYSPIPISSEMNEEIKNVVVYPEFKLPDTSAVKVLGLPYHHLKEVWDLKDAQIIIEDRYGRYEIIMMEDFIGPCNSNRLPYAVLELEFDSPLGTLENKPLMEMWVHLLNLFSGKKLNPIFKTSLYILELTVVNNHLKLGLEGPSAHLTDLLESIFAVFDSFEKHIDEDRMYFEDEKVDRLEDLDNDMLAIEKHPDDILNFILKRDGISIFHRKQKLKRTSFEGFRRFVRRFASRMFVTVETFGSVTKKQVEAIENSLRKISYRAYRKPLSSSPDRATLLPLGYSILRFRHKNTDYHTSTVLCHYQFGVLQQEDDVAAWRFLYLVLANTAFLQLRTKEQLGYRVRLSKSFKCGSRGLNFKITTQPDYYTTEHVDFRISHFLQEFFKYHFRTAETFKTLTKDYNNLIKPVTYELAKDMYHDYLLPQGPKYRKLSIQLVGHKVTPSKLTNRNNNIPKNKKNAKSNTIESCDNENEDDDLPWLIYDYNYNPRQPLDQYLPKNVEVQLIQDVQEFKRSLELQPNPDPAKNRRPEVD